LVLDVIACLIASIVILNEFESGEDAKNYILENIKDFNLDPTTLNSCLNDLLKDVGVFLSVCLSI
jgi:hypothetical protein